MREDVYNLLLEKLKKKKMTQNELAKELGVSRQNLQGLIKGKHENIKLFIKILEWLDEQDDS